MGIFTALLVEALTGAANAGISSYAHGQAPHSPSSTDKKKRRGCSSCDALKAVERAKERIARGKL
jgi:hypothetical protein